MASSDGVGFTNTLLGCLAAPGWWAGWLLEAVPSGGGLMGLMEVFLFTRNGNLLSDRYYYSLNMVTYSVTY